MIIPVMEIIKNKKAYFDYEILEKYDAGIMLHGHEVKSIRNKKIHLKGGYVSLKNDEAWLENVQIDPYQPTNQPEENRMRKRKLLLNRREIDKINTFSEASGITIVPLKVFLKGNKVKIQIGICRGKKKYDKRETIKKRDVQRQVRQNFKAH